MHFHYHLQNSQNIQSETSTKLLGHLKKGVRWRTIADKLHIKVNFRHNLPGAPHGRRDPSFVIAKCTSAEACEQD
jgi:hypothetical protein